MNFHPKRILRGFTRSEYFPIAMLILASLILGFILTPHFGASWDEAGDTNYGRRALKAYSNPGLRWEEHGNRKYYGPSYFMLQEVVSKVMINIFPNWLTVEVGHFMNFMSFQVGTLALYAISRRYASRKSALIAAILFSTQPLLFGHAFINSKDLPFMVLFLSSVALGLSAIEKFPIELNLEPNAKGEVSPGSSSISEGFQSEWRTLGKVKKFFVFGAIVFALLAFINLYITTSFPLSIGHQIVGDAYKNLAWEPVNQLFQYWAQHSDMYSVSAYISKATTLFYLTRHWILLASLIPLMLIGWVLFRKTRLLLWRNHIKPSLREWNNHRFLHILLGSAVVLGLATSTRLFGPFAGLLVSGAAMMKHRKQAIAPLVIYWFVAAVFTYLFWPYLWRTPIINLLESLKYMVDNPWRGVVLYQGEVFGPNLLPWHYIPFLMMVQFTEPTIILGAIGFLALVVRSTKPHSQLNPRFLPVIWISLPIFTQVARQPSLYDNFRQLLFAIPPLFIFCACGMDVLFTRVRKTLLQTCMIIGILLPGFISIGRLHPYQYVYYNSLVGGVEGASRRFELDYWCTSYKDATQYINTMLPQNEVVAYWGTTSPAESYIRDDIVIMTFYEEKDLQEINPSVAVICTRSNNDEELLEGAEILSEITIQGVPLTVIKRVNR